MMKTVDIHTVVGEPLWTVKHKKVKPILIMTVWNKTSTSVSSQVGHRAYWSTEE